MNRVETARIRGVDGFILTTAHLSVTVLTGKGMDLLAIKHLATGIDPLWKSRWGGGSASARRLYSSSLDAWFASCQGGWQLLVPSGGSESLVGGVLHPQHGEACMADFEVVASSASDTLVRIEAEARLGLSPLHVVRRIELLADQPIMRVQSRVTNEGGEAVPLMATEHPTLGRPFLSPGTTILTNAVSVETDATYVVPHSPYPPGTLLAWPGETVDLGRLPEDTQPRQLLAYLAGFDDVAWYSVRSAATGCFFGLVWRSGTFPYAWLFEELHGSKGYPWFSNSYLMAVEPATTKSGRGLSQAVENCTATWLEPGESWESSVLGCVGRADEEEPLMASTKQLALAETGFSGV